MVWFSQLVGLEEEASSSRSVASDPELLLLQLHLDLIWRSPRRKSSISRQRKERTDMLANASLDDGRYQLESEPSMTRQPKLFHFVSLQTLGQKGKVFYNHSDPQLLRFPKQGATWSIAYPSPSTHCLSLHPPPPERKFGHPRITSNVFFWQAFPTSIRGYPSIRPSIRRVRDMLVYAHGFAPRAPKRKLCLMGPSASYVVPGFHAPT